MLTSLCGALGHIAQPGPMRRVFFAVAAIVALAVPVQAGERQIATRTSFGCSSVHDLRTANQMVLTGRTTNDVLAMTDCIVVPEGSWIDPITRLGTYDLLAIVGINGKDYRLIVHTASSLIKKESEVYGPAPVVAQPTSMHKPDIPGSEMYVTCVVGLSATISEHHRGKEVEPAINQAFDYCQQYAPDVSDADLTELAKYIYTFLDPMLDLP